MHCAKIWRGICLLLSLYCLERLQGAAHCFRLVLMDARSLLERYYTSIRLNRNKLVCGYFVPCWWSRYCPVTKLLKQLRERLQVVKYGLLKIDLCGRSLLNTVYRAFNYCWSHYCLVTKSFETVSRKIAGS